MYTKQKKLRCVGVEELQENCFPKSFPLLYWDAEKTQLQLCSLSTQQSFMEMTFTKRQKTNSNITPYISNNIDIF